MMRPCGSRTRPSIRPSTCKAAERYDASGRVLADRTSTARAPCTDPGGGQEVRYSQAARPAPPIIDMGPRRGDGSARAPARRDRSRDLLLRPTQPMAARHEREHQRAATPIVFPEGHHLSRHSRDELEAVAAALNRRPRKTLRWRTPAEALDDLLRSAQRGGVATTP
jgi:hypothetical protein